MRPLAVLLLLSLGCQPASDRLELRRPQALAGLEGLDIEASLLVYREARQCQGEPELEHALEAQGDRYVGTVHLRPGIYYFCVRFRSGAIELGAYRDIELQVETDVDSELPLRDADFRYRHLDEDGDGIANLDELRYGFSLGEVDADPHEVVALPEQAAFRVGAPEGEGSFVEWPEHEVMLPAFAIDRHEVSVARYRLGVARGVCAPPVGRSVAEFLGDDADATVALPVAGVTQADAARFCAEVAGGRLPTEFEWEYAADPRGHAYPWGNTLEELDDSRCEFVNARFYPGGNPELASTPCHADADLRPTLVAVDHYDAPVLGRRDIGCADLPGAPGGHDGACQLAGNAWEWTTSLFAPYDGAPWQAPDEELIVIRGGSADSLDYSLRTSFRVGVRSDLSSHPGLAGYVGFRCVYDE